MVFYSINSLDGNDRLNWAKTDPILIAIIEELSIRFLNPILRIRINIFAWFDHVTYLIIDSFYCSYYIWGSNTNSMYFILLVCPSRQTKYSSVQQQTYFK